MTFHGFLESLRKLPDALPLLPISSRPTIFLAKSPYPGGPLLCTDPFTRFGPQIWYRNHSPVSGTHDALGALHLPHPPCARSFVTPPRTRENDKPSLVVRGRFKTLYPLFASRMHVPNDENGFKDSWYMYVHFDMANPLCGKK